MQRPAETRRITNPHSCRHSKMWKSARREPPPAEMYRDIARPMELPPPSSGAQANRHRKIVTQNHPAKSPLRNCFFRLIFWYKQKHTRTSCINTYLWKRAHSYTITNIWSKRIARSHRFAGRSSSLWPPNDRHAVVTQHPLSVRALPGTQTRNLTVRN